MSLEWSPKSEHFEFKSPSTLEQEEKNKLERARQQYLQEYTENLNAFEKQIVKGKSDRNNAELGCALAKAALKIASTYNLPEDFNYKGLRADLVKILGDERQADLILSGWSGEFAFARALTTETDSYWGARAYLPTIQEDMNGIDLWVDPSESELDDFARSESPNQDSDEQEYNYAAISIKSLASVPPVDFPLLISCRSLEELESQLENNRGNFESFYKQQEMPERKIQEKWDKLMETAVYAAKRLNGYTSTSKEPRFPSVHEKYDNVIPFVGFVPSPIESYGRYTNGFPKEKLMEQITTSLMSEVGNA